MLGFISTIVIAIVISLIAYAIAGNKILNGFWGAVPLGILGAWIGAYVPIFQSYGPSVDNAALIPSAIGAALLIGIFGLFRKPISQMTQ